MRRHWRNCTETPKDHSVPSSPSVPIKQDVPSSPFDSSASHWADSPLAPGQTTTAPGASPPPPPPPPTALAPDGKMAVQPPSLRVRFDVSAPEIATPVPPVQPRMTRAQAQEMRGWFLAEVWRCIRHRLGSWRLWRLCGARSPPARLPAPAAARVEEDAGSDEDADVDVDVGAQNQDQGQSQDRSRSRNQSRNQKLWGEERDSWANKGYAPYFGAQWDGVLPGPGHDDLPAVPANIVDEEAAGEAAC